MKYTYLLGILWGVSLPIFAQQTWTPLTNKAYNQRLNVRNSAIDQQLMLRQRRFYFDEETKHIVQTLDSLRMILGKQYEMPIENRQNVADCTQKIEKTDKILHQQLNNSDFFRHAATQFTQLYYEANPTFKSLQLKLKTKSKKSNSLLAQALQDFYQDKNNCFLTLKDVQLALNPSELMLELVCFADSNAQKHYGAFVISHDQANYVRLCSQAQLNQVLMEKKAVIEGFIIQLYAPQNHDISLYELIWRPLLPFLDKKKRIYYAPDGDLYRLNLGAIAEHRDNAPLCQNYEFVRINTARSLLDKLVTLRRNAHWALQTPEAMDILNALFGSVNIHFYDPNQTRLENDAVLFGNINYNMDSSAIKNSKKKTVIVSTRRPQPNRGKPDESWEALRSTKPEVDTIDHFLKTIGYKSTVYEGFTASEERIKQIGNGKKSPRILHIATHGFFEADSSRAEHPLNQSGLIFAGANYAWQAGKPKQGMEDGILTAFEIGNLKLQNTELVVLSACETGLGQIINNEGVLGLQSAFKKAGVKNIMVSLWEVADEPTQWLMTRFYNNALSKNMPMRSALQEAQNWLRLKNGYENPYYWAAFVLLE